MELLQGNIWKIHLKSKKKRATLLEVNFEKNVALRDYQLDALKRLEATWTGIKSLILPCGTGKTKICGHYVENAKFKTVIFASPLRIQAKQIFDRIKPFLSDHSSLLLDCDSDGSTKFESVSKIINKNCFISSTFKSFEEVLCNLFNEDTKYDLLNSILVIDEAHNLTNNESMIKLVQKFPKVLLVTATAQSNMDEIIGSDTIFTYSITDAIKNKYICDYNIYLPVITQDESHIEKPRELEKSNNVFHSKCLFIINGMLKTGSRRCIVYLTKSEEYENFKNAVNDIMENYHGLPYWVNFIHCDTTQKRREKTLRDFEKTEDRPDTIKFLCSIRILDEGIDLVKCDSIFITKMGDKASDIRTIQRLFRANRIDVENPSKIANCFMWCDDLNKSLSILQMLKNNDQKFNLKIKIIESNYDSQHTTKSNKILEEQNKKLDTFISIKCLSFDELWKFKKDLLFEFCEKNNRCIYASEKYKDYAIGEWLNRQKQHITSTDDKLYIDLSKNNFVKENLDFCLNREDRLQYDEAKQLLFKFCEEHKRVPSRLEIYNKFGLGRWYGRIKESLNNKESEKYISLAKNVIVLQNIDKYLENKNKNGNKERLTRQQHRDLLFAFCDKNDRIPSNKSKDKDEKKTGTWLQDMKKKINTVNDDCYIFLSSHKKIKENLDDYIKNKQMKK